MSKDQPNKAVRIDAWGFEGSWGGSQRGGRVPLLGIFLIALGLFLAAGEFFPAAQIGASAFFLVVGVLLVLTGLKDRSDLALYVGLLVYYASINRFFYIVLTAVVMTGSVMVSYTRARAENTIPKCKVGFLERPERIVLIIIGALFGRMAAVLWVIAVLSNLTVIHRMIYTWREAARLED